MFCAAIVRLILSRNRLTDLPAQTDMFATTLTTLDLSYNKMTRVSPAVVLLHRLQTLNVQGNMLSTLPEEISVLECLTDLVIAYNRFQVLPPAIYGLPALETIVASNNQISTVWTAGANCHAHERLEPPGLRPSSAQ